MKPFVLFLISSIFLIMIGGCFASTASVHWGYFGLSAPQNWSNLDQKYALCKEGHMQSPINILTQKTVKKPYSLSISYLKDPLIIIEDGVIQSVQMKNTIENTGHGVQVNFPKHNEKILYSGVQYTLQQFHIHTPSENKIDGISYPAEIHFVHRDDKGDGLVIAVFIKAGPVNPVLQELIDKFPKQRGSPEFMKTISINPGNLLPNNHSYYSFKGSLTTPGCNEGIQWLVMPNPITASKKQIKEFLKIVKGNNARPVQPLNGRIVSYSRE